MMPALPVFPLSSALSGHSSLVLEKVLEKFRSLGLNLVPKEGEAIAAEPLPSLLFLTGGTEHLALEFAGKVQKPLLFLAHFGHNSLPAALETLARLREEGRKAWLLTEADGEELLRFAQVAALARELWGKRVGLIGGASPWLIASSPNPSVFWEKLGLEIVEIPLSALRERIPPEAEILPEGEALGVGESERRMAGRVYAGLQALIAEYGISALSIACFGLLSEGCTACWGLARLSDEGLPAGCEGDLPALLALWLGRLVSGSPGFLANPAEVDLKRERLLLAHCTVPISLAESFVLRTHFESGIGLAVAGKVKPGLYTLFRLGGKRLEKAFIVEGTVLPEWPGREDLCRTQVWFKMPKGALEKLLREPLGNHHVLILGHHRPILRLFHEVFLSD